MAQASRLGPGTKTVPRGGDGAPVKPLERWLPTIMAVAALIAGVVVLPTALRPPPDQTNQSAEFSPDAPPDQQTESIVAALGRASSGSSTEAAPVEQAAVEAPPDPATLPPKVQGARRGRCFGDPPRQTDSLYSAPCAPAFVGDNGGATYRGVTKDAIKVAIEVCSGTLQTTYDGKVPDSAPTGEGTKDRTYRIFRDYFNANFEFYGRKLELYSIVADNNSGNLCDETAFRNAFASADEQYGPFFGVLSENPGVVDEAVRRGIAVGGTYGNSQEWYQAHAPYVHSWLMDGTKLLKFSSEFLCKQMWGRKATFTDDASINGRDRKYGAILFRSATHTANAQMLEDEFKRQCGGHYDRIIEMNTADANQTRGVLAQAMLQFRSENMTTLMCYCDWLTTAVFGAEATSYNYFPEWFMPGTGEEDRNELAGLYDDRQWKHAVGIKGLELARPDEETDWYRAYKSMDPDHDLDHGIGRYLFPNLLQYANGVQMAGPKVTPATLLDGLAKMPKRPPNPEWAVAGGYGPGDFTYTDYVSLVWWSNDVERPEPDDGTKGAYCHLYKGKRFAIGELPTEVGPYFQDCTARAPTGEQAPSG